MYGAWPCFKSCLEHWVTISSQKRTAVNYQKNSYMWRNSAGLGLVSWNDLPIMACAYFQLPYFCVNTRAACLRKELILWYAFEWGNASWAKNFTYKTFVVICSIAKFRQVTFSEKMTYAEPVIRLEWRRFSVPNFFIICGNCFCKLHITKLKKIIETNSGT